MKSLIALLALSVVLTGCVNVGNRSAMPAVVYYVLDDAAPAAEATPARADAQKDADPLRAEARVASRILLVLDTATGSFYDTDQLVFSRSAGTRGQYQFARWTERPGKRFADLMRARLDRQGIWSVSAAGGYVRGDVLLDTELVEFYHDATRQPGHMRLVLRAELVDLKQRTILGRRVFEQQVALTRYDAAGAAEASNQAARRTLDELVDWLATLQ
ncbi:MAG: ABC-type transport auxiliary lipoprotein family protein [Thiobacillus sp.]|nr:ABC-type transport auxiliary lipoprotein family protein [Thiobacillus sp.]